MNLYRVAEELARRLGSIFLRDKDRRRPVYGATRKFQEDPHWRDLDIGTLAAGEEVEPTRTRPPGTAARRRGG